MCSPSFNCVTSGPSRQNCQSIIERYEEQSNRGLEPLEHASNDTDEHQTLRHTVLLIILLCSMFVVNIINKILTDLE